MIRRLLAVILLVVLPLPCLPRSAAATAPLPVEVLPGEVLPGEPVTLPIIMYHEVKNTHWGKDAISPWEFESDLKYLKKSSFTAITMADLIDWFYNGAALPPHPIIITFDDGYLSTYKYVLPLLKKYDIKIVLSIIVKDTDDFTDTLDDNVDYSHVTWSQLAEMLNSGLVEVQNHSYNLHTIRNGRYGCVRTRSESPEEYAAVLKNDLRKAQSEIFSMTARVPTTYTYPYGRYNDEADAILRQMGFRATLSCRYGINIISHERPDLFRLRRLCRAHDESLEELLEETYKKIMKKLPTAPADELK